MAFWSGETLEKSLPTLVKPFDKKNIDCAAYTLHMGGEAYVSPSAAEQDAKHTSIHILDKNQSFAIPAGQFAFLLTEEKIRVPRGHLAFISMKSGIKLRGLVNVSGFHVDPGYNGNLIFAVFNAGPRPVHLKRGEACFLIWYAELDDKQSKKFRGPDKRSYSAISTELVTMISGEVMSFEGLSAKIKDIEKNYDEKIHEVQKEHEKLKVYAVLIAGAVIASFLTPNLKNMWDWLWTANAPYHRNVPAKLQQNLTPPTAPK